MKLLTALLLVSALILTVPHSLQADDEFSADHVEFFETKIRPLLATHCLECHGSTKSESGFRVDSRNAILAGGDSAEPGAVAGKPESSLIIQSVLHQSDYDMPPNEKLSQQQANDLAHWVKLGLPWPADSEPISKVGMPELLASHKASHWSFQPVRQPPLPDVNHIAQVRAPIDRLILSKLESNGLSFSPMADRRTLIRRATFDLIGLPPTMEEVNEFFIDNSNDDVAFRKVLDRLLASPQYGERWARHWLDVARYADTSGYTFDNADRNYPFAFTYRDYVIDAFNDDLPYDQFIREQLAADYLEVPADKKTLAALGFITVGRKYIARPDTIDDQIDVTTRGLLGLTVSCARCHDHKYDAIPTEDYYSLYGVFENCHTPEELPLIGSAEIVEKLKPFFDELEERKKAIVSYENEYVQRLQTQMDEFLTDYLVRAFEPENETLVTSLPSTKLTKDQINEHAISKWRTFLVRQAKVNSSVKPLAELFVLPNDQFEKQAKQLIAHWVASDNKYDFDPLVVAALQNAPPKNKAELGQLLSELLADVRQAWVTAGSVLPAIKQFDVAELKSKQELARLLFGSGSPATINRKNLKQYFNVAEKKAWQKLKSSLAEHHAATPPGVARAMAIRENENPHNERVMLRGNINRRGEEVPRRFVALLSDAKRQPFKNRAGRLELANAIANKDNPLTARVLVNRVWMHHFSKPLVETPSDFGIRCEQPVQHELLDFLASDFMQSEWSIKHLHRSIMMSQAYRQSSDDRAECVSVDPENQLLWKMNRRRLEFEAVRDSMLAVSSQLDATRYGKAVDMFGNQPVKRRTIYGKIDRQDLPNLLRVFDIASPDQSSARRIRTTVPQQSLFMLNHNFIVRQSRSLANVVGTIQDDASGQTQQRRINRLYETVFQRVASRQEIEIGRAFLKKARLDDDLLTAKGQLASAGNGESKTGAIKADPTKNGTANSKSKPMTPWQRYAQILLCTNEFEFVD
jgi:cytochrome c553